MGLDRNAARDLFLTGMDTADIASLHRVRECVVVKLLDRERAERIGHVSTQARPSKRRRFTRDEVTFLRRNYRRIGVEGCAVALNRSEASVASKAQSLDLSVPQAPALRRRARVAA